LIETVAHGAVDDHIAHTGREAAEDRGIHMYLHLDVFAKVLREGGGQALALVLVEGDRRAHLGDLVLAVGGGPLDQALDDPGQVAGVAGADDEADRLVVIGVALPLSRRSVMISLRFSDGMDASVSVERSSSEPASTSESLNSSSSTTASAPSARATSKRAAA
jgi:hypothetical protein